MADTPTPFWRELPAGLSLAASALPGIFVAGTLTYQVLGPAYASLGLLAGLVAAVVGGGVGALVRNPTFIPTTPGIATALLQAAFATSVIAATGDAGLALLGIALSAALAGALQVLFGMAGWGALARYVPHPVLAGFSAGVALLLLLDQIPRLAMPASAQDAAALVQAGPLLVAAVLVGLMLAVSMLWPRLPAPALGLLAGVAAYQLLPGIPAGETFAAVGGTLGLAELRNLAVPELRSILALPPELLWVLLGNAVAIAAIGLLDTLLALRAAKVMADIEIPSRREVAGLGAANLASSVVGGVAMTTSLILVGASHRAGGRTRATPLLACAVLALVLALFPWVIGVVPVVVLGALLVFFALRTFDRSMLDILGDAFASSHPHLRGRAVRNLGVFLAVALTTALYQPMFGALIGFILSCVVFIVDMARPVIAARATGEHLRSRRGRPTAHHAVLDRRGHRVAVLRLRGVLFFGNADELDSRLRETRDAFDHVILDMRRVADIDISGKRVLVAMAHRLKAAGKTVHASGLPPELADLLGSGLTTFRDLDAALEHVEELLLAGEPKQEGDAPPPSPAPACGSCLRAASASSCAGSRADRCVSRASRPARRLASWR